MSAPIPDVPAPPIPGGISTGAAGSSVSADASFTKPELNASPCEFAFKLPTFSFGLQIPPFKFPPFDIPIPHFKLTLSCDLSNPIDISASLEPGGGRVPNGDPSPDDDDSF
jgi:hypothetical protein